MNDRLLDLIDDAWSKHHRANIRQILLKLDLQPNAEPGAFTKAALEKLAQDLYNSHGKANNMMVSSKAFKGLQNILDKS